MSNLLGYGKVVNADTNGERHEKGGDLKTVKTAGNPTIKVPRVNDGEGEFHA